MQKLLSSIPRGRALLYLLIIGLLPLFFLLFDFSAKQKALRNLSMEIARVEAEASRQRHKLSTNALVREHFSKSDHAYLEHHVEALPLLKKERASLEKMMGTSLFSGNELLEKRLMFLRGEENQLRFNEISVAASDGMQETHLVLARPVEVDLCDLKEILERIEEQKEGAPQLLIEDIQLQKVTHGENEVYELFLQLLKREFLHEKAS